MLGNVSGEALEDPVGDLSEDKPSDHAADMREVGSNDGVGADGDIPLSISVLSHKPLDIIERALENGSIHRDQLVKVEVMRKGSRVSVSDAGSHVSKRKGYSVSNPPKKRTL